MLPATGLFRAIYCPFFEKDMCTRPYCHFKHAKPDIPIPKLVTYNATPKILLKQTQTKSDVVPVKKKPKLEYIPMPTIVGPKYVPTKKLYTPAAENPPETKVEYIPTKIVKESEAPVESIVEKQETEITIPADVKEEEPKVDVEAKELEQTADVEIKELEKKEERKSDAKEDVKKQDHRDRDDKHRKERDKRKSSDKERSSASQKDKDDKSKSSRSDKDRERDKIKDRDREKEKNRIKEKSRVKDKQNEKDKEKEKSRRTSSSSKTESKSSSRTSSSKSSSHRHGSSKSSSSKDEKKSSSTDKESRSKRERSSSSSSKAKAEAEIYRQLIENPPSDLGSDSDEDDVLAQCKMIFEEYQPEKHKTENEENGSKTNGGHNMELIDIFAEKVYDDRLKKKRVAYEGSKESYSTPVVKKANHVQNALNSVYVRQEIARKQQEELFRKQQEEEEEKAKKQSKPEPIEVPPDISSNGMSTTSFYNLPKSPEPPQYALPRSRFSPATNVLAFQRAKEKIEMLRKAKTPAQTSSKVVARTAHVAPSTPTQTPEVKIEQPAPPVLEPTSTKISYNIRMQYYNLMVKHCLNIYTNCEDAWDRAQTEELAVFKKCSTAMIYKSSALLSINKLRKESNDAGNIGTEKNKTISHDVILAGKMGQKTSWSVNKKIKTDSKSSTYTLETASSTGAYKMIYECILTEELLRSNGYPRPGDVSGKAKMYTPKQSRPPKEDERYCSRCSKVFKLDIYDEPAVDSCNYHGKSTGYRRGFADNLHRCCQQPAGTPGCMYGNYHVTHFLDYDNLTGFVKTIPPRKGYTPSKKDVFALDCEMCYTTGGLELTRITVVDINEKTVYDALVKPDNKIVDYNTTYSGITEQMLENTTTTLRNVQAVLLSMFNAETILIGHSLESDLKALKIVHGVVVDTSVLYPHKMGPPKKRALKTLCIENLKKIIQENEAGHDSAEDAVVCIQLIKHYLRNRII